MECNICKSTINSNQLIKLNDCTHEFCQECLYKYLKNKIDQKKFQFITCPSCSIELSINVIKQYCPTHFDKYQALKENLFVRCYICQEDVQIHVCQEDVCKQCGQEHQENCNIWICPKCYQPVRKNNQNHIVCNCQYEFCWICFSKMTKYHYSFWNLCGCPIPESKKLDINPLKHPQMIKYLMILPKLVLAPILCLYRVRRFLYKVFKYPVLCLYFLTLIMWMIIVPIVYTLLLPLECFLFIILLLFEKFKRKIYLEVLLIMFFFPFAYLYFLCKMVFENYREMISSLKNFCEGICERIKNIERCQ